MRQVILICIVVALIIHLTSCGDAPPPRKEEPPPTPPIGQTLKEKQDKDLENAKKDADEEKDPVKKLEKEIKALKLERDAAQRNENAATVQLGTKEKELNTLKLKNVQNWLYGIAGAIAIASFILGGLAVYFRSGKFAWAAVGAFGLACFVATCGWLTTYIFYIAIGGGILFFLTILTLVVMMLRRDRALFQLTKGVSAIKSHVPNYKEIIGEHIEEAEDKLIDSVRKRWADPSLQK